MPKAPYYYMVEFQDINDLYLDKALNKNWRTEG